jgi:hypothetical protein
MEDRFLGFHGMVPKKSTAKSTAKNTKESTQNAAAKSGWLPGIFGSLLGNTTSRTSADASQRATTSTADKASARVSSIKSTQKTSQKATPKSTQKNKPKIAPSIAIMKDRLEEILRHQQIAPEVYSARSRLIQTTVLQHSRAMADENFSATSVADLRLMSELYDSIYFDSSCIALAKHYGMAFRWSSRMTRAGGKTTRTVRRATIRRAAEIHYEITLSSSLLFQTFQEDSRPIKVCGRPCHHRLEAMQRIVEHEAIHLAEMLVWIDSDCAAGRFQAIANRLFGHTEHRHELVTQRERAAKLFDIRVGSRVYFMHEGHPVQGIVNRITRRATVLVESPQGEMYTNHKRYLKYYIPITALKISG